MFTYIASKGEDWKIVSIKAYGSLNYVERLRKDNPDFDSVLVFQGGEKLKVRMVGKFNPFD